MRVLSVNVPGPGDYQPSPVPQIPKRASSPVGCPPVRTSCLQGMGGLQPCSPPPPPGRTPGGVVGSSPQAQALLHVPHCTSLTGAHWGLQQEGKDMQPILLCSMGWMRPWQHPGLPTPTLGQYLPCVWHRSGGEGEVLMGQRAGCMASHSSCTEELNTSPSRVSIYFAWVCYFPLQVHPFFLLFCCDWGSRHLMGLGGAEAAASIPSLPPCRARPPPSCPAPSSTLHWSCSVAIHLPQQDQS